MKRVLALSLLTAVLAFSSGGRMKLSARSASPSGGANSGSDVASGPYTLVAWSELGMHCIDGKDYSIFSVLPPYNVVHAQLFQKGEPPVPVTSGVTITYVATPDTRQSINSISSSKTNFWTYVQTLFHANPK